MPPCAPEAARTGVATPPVRSAAATAAGDAAAAELRNG
eukprot:CAMPEP_0177224694 /NCGR_PEP_ID=MMETSP0367-20130122/39155_1 /TAXON_ID=447022 ORGANISM="Scrippsiella hangoei-like, Strain SHHI-4" /NCGR_SAMPLE_ID=MMETSP0367 /ASSEMBLY_ACC=CAM_ASM_000362 /LENGTH=37 /DNA_ID= /DNA_START= /DNA_END= /DNA_ORIENTATION=